MSNSLHLGPSLVTKTLRVKEKNKKKIERYDTPGGEK